MSKQNRADFSTMKYAYREVGELCKDLNCSPEGLTSQKAEQMAEKYGTNEFTPKKSRALLKSIRRAFLSPFNIILIFLAVISVVADFLPQSNISHSSSTSVIIFAMVIISGAIRLTQELKAKNAAEALDRMIREDITVKRNGKWEKIPADELVCGDLISFSAGDKIPADVRLTKVKDLFTSQAALTGESTIIENTDETLRHTNNDKLSACRNLAFMSTTVISGKGEGIVFAVGTNTLYGSFINEEKEDKNYFKKGASSIAFVMLKFIAVLIPVIFVILGITGGKWFEAFAFALSVAVGLVPEMLPMVVTACLAKGSITMSKKQSIVKNINAMQSFGDMDVLCLDKTGTLTNESILLEYYMDILGNESGKVLDLAYLNSVNHSGVGNPIDNAIIACNTMPGKGAHFTEIYESHKKLDEIPFDHSRKFVSILLQEDDKGLMITKGDIANVISRCTHIEFNGEILPMTSEHAMSVSAVVDEMLSDGMKVIALAKKYIYGKNLITMQDENEMILCGYLAFLMPPS